MLLIVKGMRGFLMVMISLRMNRFLRILDRFLRILGRIPFLISLGIIIVKSLHLTVSLAAGMLPDFIRWVRRSWNVWMSFRSSFRILMWLRK